MLKNPIGICAVFFLCLAASVQAADKEAARSVRDAIESYRAGDFEKAQELYAEAELKCPECSEIAYNRGLASYRQRDFGAARAFFSSALQTSDLGLEAKAKYNLGNVAFSEALEKMSDLEEAIESARTAIFHYRDALELDPDDVDARTNIEIAQLLIKDLLDKQKQEQEEQKQDKNQQNQNQQNQDQQNQDQQNQEKSDQEKQEDQQKQDGDKQDGEDEQKQDKGEQGDEKQDEKKDGQSDQNQDKQNEPQPNDEQQQAQQQQQREVSASQRKLTKEEFAQMMQAVRDKEAQRRKDNKRRMRVRQAPVSKDW